MGILATLRKPPWLKLQILAFIQLSFIYNPIRRWYIKKYIQNDTEHEYKPLMGKRYINRHVAEIIGFTSRSPILLIYFAYSCTYMAYVVVKTVFPVHAVIALFNPSLPAHCYIPGRFLLYGPMAKNFGALVCIYHLIWRSWKSFLDQYYICDIAAFLLIDEQSFARNSNREGEELEMCNLSPYDRYSVSLMYFSVKSESKVFLKLRPNRSKVSRDNIIKNVVLITVTLLISLTVLLATFAPMVYYSSNNDIQYTRDFPRCSPLMNDSYYRPQLHQRFNYHKFVIMVFDWSESVMIWIDCFVGVTLIVVLPYMVNQDLLCYLDHLNNHVKKLLEQIRLRDYLGKLNLPVASGSSETHHSDLFSHVHQKHIERESRETRALLHDFFLCVKGADFSGSGSVMTAVTCWLSYFSCLTYLEITKPNEKHMIASARLPTVGLLVALLFISKEIFAFRRNVLRTYPLICSLMAQDDTSCQMQYMEIIRYYLEQNYAAYTIGGRPYTPVTFLTIAGWTFTSATIVRSFAW